MHELEQGDWLIYNMCGDALLNLFNLVCLVYARDSHWGIAL